MRVLALWYAAWRTGSPENSVNCPDTYPSNMRLPAATLLIALLAVSACKKDDLEDPAPPTTTPSNGVTADTCWYQCRIIGDWELEHFQVLGSSDYVENSILYQFHGDQTVEVTRNNYLGVTDVNTVNYEIINYAHVPASSTTFEESGSLIIGNDTFSIEGIYRFDVGSGSITDGLVFGPYADDKLELVDVTFSVNDSIYSWHFLRQ
jgi:hypothetical protein